MDRSGGISLKIRTLFSSYIYIVVQMVAGHGQIFWFVLVSNVLFLILSKSEFGSD